MKKVLMTCLVLLSVLVSSTAFSAIPEGKFPIQIISSRSTPNSYERTMTIYLNQAFKNSPKYRITNVEENRIMIRILIEEFIPGVLSSDIFASAPPIQVYTIVWTAKPKNEHAFYIWHDIGRLTSEEQVARYILKQADIMVWKIKNQCPYVFE